MYVFAPLWIPSTFLLRDTSDSTVFPIHALLEVHFFCSYFPSNCTQFMTPYLCNSQQPPEAPYPQWSTHQVLTELYFHLLWFRFIEAGISIFMGHLSALMKFCPSENILAHCHVHPTNCIIFNCTNKTLKNVIINFEFQRSLTGLLLKTVVFLNSSLVCISLLHVVLLSLSY